MDESNVTPAEELMKDIDLIADDPPAEPPAPAEGLAGPLSDLPPEKVAALEARLAEFKKNAGKTVSGSEDPDAPPSEFNPAEWDFDPELEHLYRRAHLEETPEGPKWVVIEHQYWNLVGAWHVENSGQPKMQGGMAVRDKHNRIQYHPKGIDHMVQDIVNGPDGMLSREKGWRLSALLPVGMSQGIAVLERQAKRALPDPKPIIKPEEQPLEKTTDEELARMQEKAQEWTGENTAPAEQPTVTEGDQNVRTEEQN